MARMTVVSTNFTAGELTPKVHGRTDISRYQNGVEKMRDAIPQIHGGAKRRPGSLFVQEVKNSAQRTRLVPFSRNAENVYMLEFGHGYMRVYKNGAPVLSGGVPYEIPTGIGVTQLPTMDYTQAGDTMFLFHEQIYPQRLVCAGDTSWSIGNAPFTQEPFDENGTYPAATLTPSATGPVGESIWLCAGDATAAPLSTSATSWVSGGASVTTGLAHGLVTGDAVKVSGTIPFGYNVTTAVVVGGASLFTYDLREDPGEVTTQGKVTKLTQPAIFTAGDIGKTVRINGGTVLITAVPSPSVAQGVVKQDLSSMVAAVQDAWSLHVPAWSVANGYPRTGVLYQQRLVCGGSPALPQTIWGSMTGAYLDFTQGVADDDAFAFTISGDVTTQVRYLTGGRSLVAFTSTGEFTIDGGMEKPLTPTNAKILSRKNYGCAGVRPVRVGEAELFVQRSQRKVRSFSYSLASDDWNGPDLSVLAEHLTLGDIADMCWQQETDSIVWLARSDGALLSITLDREQDVTGWAWHEEFSGAVESLASISLSDGDQVWMVVRRTINGATKRYVERLSGGARLDCAVAGTMAGASVFGLGHLEGEEVHALDTSGTNPIYMGAYTVSAGAIVLPRAATTTQVGKLFRPRVKLLTPEIQTGMGAASGNAQRTSEVTARFHQTASCSVNGRPIVFRQTGTGALDVGIEPFTGIKRLEQLGWERGDSPLEFTQEEPLDFHLLSVTRKFTVND